MIKNLTKLGCHLGGGTYYLQIAHYLPHLIFRELTSLCGDRSNDQKTHLLRILSRARVPITGIALLPFIFVTNRHLAAASGEARLEVISVISEMSYFCNPEHSSHGSLDVSLWPLPPARLQ